MKALISYMCVKVCLIWNNILIMRNMQPRSSSNIGLSSPSCLFVIHVSAVSEGCTLPHTSWRNWQALRPGKYSNKAEMSDLCSMTDRQDMHDLHKGLYLCLSRVSDGLAYGRACERKFSKSGFYGSRQQTGPVGNPFFLCSVADAPGGGRTCNLCKSQTGASMARSEGTKLMPASENYYAGT